MTDLKRDLDALRIEREPERRGLGRWIIWTGLIVVLAALGFGGWRWITRERPIEVLCLLARKQADLQLPHTFRAVGQYRVGF